MNEHLKIELIFEDRLGIVADVAAIIARKGLNIVSMEVQKKNQLAYVYVEAEKVWADNKESIFQALQQLPECLELKPIHILPHEKREEGYKVVLDSVSDGILSIDETGVLTTINKVARKILNCDDPAVVGRPLSNLDLPAICLNEAFTHNIYRREKRNIITEKGRFQFFSTCKPIQDSSGQVMGAVEIMKDMKEIKALAHAVTEPSQITFSDIVGVSSGIKEAIALGQKIAGTGSIVSIRGESGTGKELFARAIHFESRRKGQFVPINCAALPESLLESELFGYESGAFTGARKQGKAGLFEIAKNGTVFLDEIAEMPLKVQAKILRLIQEKRVRHIGGSIEIPINARIITATNRNLERCVEEKLFREDLYYRINVLPIHIPPLRRRLEDIPVLVSHFLFQLNSRLNKKIQSLNQGARDKLNSHDWPGNVRELKNVIERAAILSVNSQINKDLILFSFELGKSIAGLPQDQEYELGHQSLRTMMDRYEKQVLSQALNKAMSIRRTASLLNVSHTTLLNKIKKHKISVSKD